MSPFQEPCYSILPPPKRPNFPQIVDTRSFASPKVVGQSFQQRLEQILLGAISRDIDKAKTVELEGPDGPP